MLAPRPTGPSQTPQIANCRPSKLDPMSRRPRRDPWWSTWPGAVGMALIAFLIAAPGLLAAQLALALRAEDSAGLDHEVTGPGLWPRVLALALIVAALAFPILTGRWGRKKWLGYLLLGLALSAVVGVVGLTLLGVL